VDKSKPAHDISIEAGEKLGEAEEKLKKAEDLLLEANIRMKRAREFEATLVARQKKLDRAFYLLGKQKSMLTERELKATERESLLHDNMESF